MCKKDKNTASKNIIHSKDLPRLHYKLTLNEQKMLMCFFGHIKRTDTFFGKEEMHISEMINYCGFQDNNPYRIVRETADSLTNKKLRYYVGKNYGFIPWMQYIVYKDGIIYYQINQAIKTELLQLYENRCLYITINPALLPKFQNGYALRIYSIIKGEIVSHNTTFEFSLKDICDMFQLSRAYNPKYTINAAANQKYRILQPAIDEINKITKIHVDFKPKKESKKIIAWEFKISKLNITTVQTSEATQTKYWYEDNVEVENAIKGLTSYGVNKSSIIPLLSNFKDKQYFLDAKEYALENLLTAQNKIENKAGWLYNAIKNYDFSISETYANMAKESELPTEIINAINTAHNWSDIIRLVKNKNEANTAIAIFTYARKRKEHQLSKYKRRYKELSYYDENGHLITDADNIIAEYDVDTEVLKILKGGTELIEDPINLE